MMKLLLASLVVALAALFSAGSAQARPHVAENCSELDPMRPCGAVGTPTPGTRTSGANSRPAGHVYGRGSVVGHPPGCPRSRFCGCGAAVRVFGTPRRDLWLAANWLRFPRAAPAPGMVAARRGHVFVLESHAGGNTWLVYDANSGRRMTRIHHRSIAGYTIVNPRA